LLVVSKAPEEERHVHAARRRQCTAFAGVALAARLGLALGRRRRRSALGRQLRFRRFPEREVRGKAVGLKRWLTHLQKPVCSGVGESWGNERKEYREIEVLKKGLQAKKG